MKKFLVVAAILSAMQVAVASAEGVPSQSKLSNLGLASMDVVSDEAGEQVRGKFLGVGGILALGGSTTGTTLGAVAFPQIAALTHISGNAPRALGNTAFAASGFATVNSATSATGNPSFTGYTNVPFVVSVADVSGSAQIGVQFFTMTAGN